MRRALACNIVLIVSNGCAINAEATVAVATAENDSSDSSSINTESMKLPLRRSPGGFGASAAIVCPYGRFLLQFLRIGRLSKEAEDRRRDNQAFRENT